MKRGRRAMRANCTDESRHDFGHKVGLEAAGPMTDIELRIRMAQSLAEVPAAAWDACAAGAMRTQMRPVKLTHEDNFVPGVINTRTSRITHLFLMIFLSSLEVVAFGRRPHRLAAPPPAVWRTRDGALVGAAPCYVKTPFARRICLRPRLGRGLRARRRRLLPQAAGGGAVHAGDRPSPAGPPRSARRSRARRRWPMRWPKSPPPTICPRPMSPSSPRRNGALLGERGFLQRTDQQFHWENAGYATFDDFLDRAVLAQAQDHPPRAQGGAGARHRGAPGSPAPTSPKRCGTPSSPSTWRPARANGAGPTSPATSSRSSARRCATASCW